MTGQKDAGVVDKQFVDIYDVTGDTGIVRALTQCDQRMGDDIDEAPYELVEGGGDPRPEWNNQKRLFLLA